jgi:ASC-1-like (ASCH) protein
MQFEKFNVQNPWFDHIKNNKKTVEGRLNKGGFKNLKVDQLLIFENDGKSVLVKIKKINLYKSFESYLMQEGLRKTLPGIETIQDGVNIYRKFYSAEMEQQYGILAIHIKKISAN